MAKNFTDFEQVSGSFTPATYPDGDAGGYLTGTKSTQANRDMFVVGYNTDEPGGERQYTINSVLLAAQASDVGLENVTNESKQYMFNDTTLTGQTTAAELFVTGNLHVEGDNVQLNTIINTTSAVEVNCDSQTPALKVTQSGGHDVVQFLYDSGNGPENAFNINQFGNIGIGVAADLNTQLVMAGDLSVAGDVYVTGNVAGRNINQDGTKLDDIDNRADVTCVNLSNVSQRLQFFKDVVPGFDELEVKKGLDILEDGDDFKKIPTSMTGVAPAINDYSVEKIKSVEFQADVTGDHSADIVLNDVPDGPWTGDTQTTHTRVTSAERARLQTVRGVSNVLYLSDNGGDLGSSHIVAAYQESYPDFWSSDNETEYRGSIIPELGRATSYISSTSADFADLYTLNVDTSGSWNQARQILTDHEQTWHDTTSVVYSNSALWHDTYTDVRDTSGTWDTSYTILQSNTAFWNSQNTVVKDLSADWKATSDYILPKRDRLTGAVSNKPNTDLTPRVTEPGEAVLDKLNITSSLTAQGESRFSGQVMVLSAGEWKPGLTTEIDVGGDKLVFVDGILIDVKQ